MKICCITSVFPRFPGDTEVPWLKETVKRCIEEGLDITVFAPSFRGLKSHQIGNIPVYRFRYFFRHWETLTHEEGAPNKIHKLHYKIITLFYIVSGTLHLFFLQRRCHFDILHIHWPFPHGILGFFINFWLRNTKIILNFHGAELLLTNKYKFVKRFLKYFIKKADGVIVNSNFTAQKVRSLFYRDSIQIIPYGTTVQPSVKLTVQSEHSNIILTVGRLIERKGHPYLIQALPEILKKFPDALLTIVGGGPEEQTLMDLITKLNLKKHVHLYGKIENSRLQELYERANVFVLPAIVDHKGDTEGLGVVLIEALNYKKAVVASDVGGIPDIIKHLETGIIVSEKNSRVIAEAVCQLLQDKRLAVNLGERGYQFVKNYYDWSVIIPKMIRFYKQIAI